MVNDRRGNAPRSPKASKRDNIPPRPRFDARFFILPNLPILTRTCYKRSER
nr:MAG TPA: hypothetical protein [Caudoviricetes sp.]